MRRVLLLLCWSVLGLHAGVLSVEGRVEKPLRIDADAFASLPQTTLEKVGLVCMSGAVKQAPKARTGVLLGTLLEQAGVKSVGNRVRNRMVVLASGSDGYGVTFSYHELFNSPAGDGVLVVHGPEGFSLYSRYDYVTGPRHVHDLTTLYVAIVEPHTTTTKGHQ
jgi:hypothetical protein